jgi:hypothetical protein
MRVPFIFMFFCLLLCHTAYAQLIRGEVVGMNDKKPLPGVHIVNIHNDINITTNTDGTFVIAGTSDELLEFRLPGYKTTRVRIPRGYIPPYFKIIMEHPPVPIRGDALAGTRNYAYDSAKARERYSQILDIPQLSPIEKIKHPFSAMSARNREIWAFQDTYEEAEKERYIDYTFNKEMVSSITGLTNDSLNRFMIRFRPGYEQLRNMNEYTLYNYVKMNARRFRNINRPINAQ